MLTPMEKLVFNSIILILFSLLVAATTMYLPNHIMTIYNRVWYYTHGENVTDAITIGKGGDAIKGISQAAMATAESVRRQMAEL